MAGKLIDYDLRIAEYRVMADRRALTEQETLKLAELVRLQKKQAIGKRYRESHKEQIKKSHAERMLADGPRIRQQRHEATKDYYRRNKNKVNAKTRLWYARNPEASRTRNASRTRPAGNIPCGHCGEQFVASVAVMQGYTEGQVKYCSKVCSARGHTSTHHYNCKACGKACTITRTAGGSPPAWCSESCRITHRSAEARRKRLVARQARELAKSLAKNGSSPPPPE